MTDEDSRREKIQEEFIRYILEQELKKQNNPDYFIEQFGKMKIRLFIKKHLQYRMVSGGI